MVFSGWIGLLGSIVSTFSIEFTCEKRKALIKYLEEKYKLMSDLGEREG